MLQIKFPFNRFMFFIVIIQNVMLLETREHFHYFYHFWVLDLFYLYLLMVYSLFNVKKNLKNPESDFFLL